jgi:hypothetical protein
MTTSFRQLDFIHPFSDGRLPWFGIPEGLTVVACSCGPIE